MRKIAVNIHISEVRFKKKGILQRKQAFNPKMQENKLFLELKNTEKKV